MWSLIRISSRIASMWRHNDVIHDEIRVILPHAKLKETTISILCNFVFSPLQLLFIVFTFKYPKSLTIYGHVAENLNFFKGPLKYLLRPLLGKNQFAVTQRTYA